MRKPNQAIIVLLNLKNIWICQFREIKYARKLVRIGYNCVLFLVYFCDNWNIVPYATHTNTAGNTWCRAPGMPKLCFAPFVTLQQGSQKCDHC